MDKLKMENFSIPKIKSVQSKDNLRSVKLTSRDAIEILNIIDHQAMNQSYKDDWIPDKLSLVDNSTLETEYRTKRKELKELGRNSRELADHYGFLFVKNQFLVSKIVKEGLKSKKAAFNPLGDNEYGVYVCKHPDVQLKIAAGKSDEVAYVLVFKIILGRCKAVQPQANLTGEPAPNYDSCSSSIPSQANDHAGILFPRSQVYLYEYSDDCLPLNRPRHCLPIAVVEYRNTRVKSKISTSPSPVTSSRRLSDHGQTFRPGTYGARNQALKRNCFDRFPSSSPPFSAEMGYNILSNIRPLVQPASSEFNFPIDMPVADNLISSNTSVPNFSYASQPVVMTTPHFSGSQTNFQSDVSTNQQHNFYLPINEIQTDGLQSDNDPPESPMSYYMPPRIADKPLHPFMRKKKKTVTNVITSNITHPAPMRKNNLIIEKLDFPAQEILLPSSSLTAVVTNVTKPVSPNVESSPEKKTDESKKKDMEVMMKTVNKLFGKVPISQEGLEVTTASDQTDIEDDTISGPHTGYDNSDVQLNAKAAPLIEKTTAESTPNLCVPSTPTKHISNSAIKLVLTSIKQTKSVINLDICENSVISPIKNIENRELPDANYVHNLAEQLQSLGNIQDVVSKLFTKGLSSNDQQQSLQTSNIFTSTTEKVTYDFQNTGHSIMSQNRSYSEISQKRGYSDTTQNTGHSDTTQNREYYGMTQNREYSDTIHKITQKSRYGSVSPRINQDDSFGNYSNSWRSPANRNSHESIPSSNDHISYSSQQHMNERYYNKSLHTWMPQSSKSSNISVNCFGDIDYRQNLEIPQQTDTRNYFHSMNADVPGFKNSQTAVSNPSERRHSLPSIVPSHDDHHCDLKDKITTIRQTSYDSFLSREDSQVVKDNSLDLSSAKTELSEIQMHKDLCFKRKMSAENNHNELNLEKQTCPGLSNEMSTAKNPSFQPKVILLDLVQIAQTSVTSCEKCKSEQDGVAASISHKKHKSVKEYLEYVGLKIPPKVKKQQRISDAKSDSKFATVISSDVQSKQRKFEAYTPLVTATKSDLKLSFSDDVFSTSNLNDRIKRQTYDERFEENDVKRVKRSSEEDEDKLVMDLEISQLDVKRPLERYGKEDDKCIMDLEMSASDVKKVKKNSGKDDIKLVMDLEISKSKPDNVGNNFNKSICESYVYSQESTTKPKEKSALVMNNDVIELKPSNSSSVMDNSSKVALVSSKVTDDDKSLIVDSDDRSLIVDSDDRSLKVSRWKKYKSKDLPSNNFSKLSDSDEICQKNERKDLLHSLSSNVDDDNDSSQVSRWEKNYSRDLLPIGSSKMDIGDKSSKLSRWEKNESKDLQSSCSAKMEDDNNSSTVCRWEKNESKDLQSSNSSKVYDNGTRSNIFTCDLLHSFSSNVDSDNNSAKVSIWEKNYSRDLLPSGPSEVDYDNNSSKIHRWEQHDHQDLLPIGSSKVDIGDKSSKISRWEKNESIDLLSSDFSTENDEDKKSKVSKWGMNDSKDVLPSDSSKVDDNSSVVSLWENLCVGLQLSTNNTNNKCVDIDMDTSKSTDYPVAEMGTNFGESFADAGNMVKNTHLKSIRSKNLDESFLTCYSNIDMNTSFGDNISDIGDSTVQTKKAVNINETYPPKHVDTSLTRTIDHNPVISNPQLTRWSVSFQMKNAVDTIRSSNDKTFGTSADDCPTIEVETRNQVNQSVAEGKIDSQENSAKQPIPSVEKNIVQNTPVHNTSISYSETDNDKKYVKLDIKDDYLKINEEKFPTFPLPNTNNKQESVILEIKVIEGCLEKLSKESEYSIMEAILEVESELIMELKHNKYICRPNQRIPNDILFDYEKNCIYATGDCFVYLTTFLTKQLFMSLLNLKHEILDAYREKQSLSGPCAKQTFLNERLNYFLNKRKLLLRTLTGLVKPSRLRQLERTRKNFLLCMDHMKQTIEQFDSSQMKYMNILFSTLTEHTCIVRSELENIHCDRN